MRTLPLATRKMRVIGRLVAGYFPGTAAYVTGIGMPALFDLPTGAVIVWTMAMVAIVVGNWLGRRSGKSRTCCDTG